jgi:hypothetical protein
VSFLVYCITREDASVHGRLPLAGNDRAVHFVTQPGLAAAISEVLDSDVAPTAPRLRTFAAVVEALHGVCTILPMRYGCVLPAEERVVALLRERAPEFMAALDGVEGCAEMSIRAIFDENPVAPSSPQVLVPKFNLGTRMLGTRREPPNVSGGRAYLAARKAYYARQTLSAQAATAVVERAAAVLRGLFVRYVSAYSPFPTMPHNVPMLSLHFLVRRERVEPFREVFRALNLSESAKMLLSGPWPPYHFV